MQIHAFVDTNIRIHYAPLDQIDWRSILGCESVVLHIAPVVTREMDEHKWGTNERLKRRAERVLRDDHARLDRQSWTLRDGVELHLMPGEPSDDTFRQHGLAATSNDDRLLASVIEFRSSNPGAEIRVITGDLGLRIKAHHQTLTSAGLPDNLKLPEEIDGQQKELRRLREELDAFKSRAPRLSLAFFGSESHLTFQLPPWIDRYAQKYERMAAQRAAHPYVSVPEDLHEDSRSYRFATAALEASGMASHHRQHNTSLRDFFSEYEKYLDAASEIEERARRTVEVRLVLMNTGTGTADDVDVFVEVKGAANVFAPGKRPKAPKEPKPPHITDFSVLAGMIATPQAAFAREIRRLGAEKPEGQPQVERTDSGTLMVRYRVSRIKQSMDAQLQPISIELVDDRAGSVELAYTVNTATLREDTTGVLRLLVATP